MLEVSSNASLVKAYLEIKEKPGSNGPRAGAHAPAGASSLVGGLGTLVFRFNPKQYSIAKTSNWVATPRAVGGKVAPEAQHVGPNGRTLTLELFFDASDSLTGDVSRDIDALMNCCNPLKSTGAPPAVVFGWGTHVSLDGYVTNVSARLTMFRPDGTPFRATASVTLTEHSEKDEPQNPTSGTRSAQGSHRSVAGDSLASISYRAYGKATYWRAIADANAIDDPMRLRPGVDLLIPAAADARAQS